MQNSLSDRKEGPYKKFENLSLLITNKIIHPNPLKIF